MKIDLAYGGAQLTLELPAGIRVDRFEAARVAREVDIGAFQKRFLSAGGNEFLSGKPLFVVNDGHRPTPTLTVWRWLDRVCEGVLDRADFLIAAGTHDAPSREHLDKIFGEFYDRVADRVSYHVAKDRERLVGVGTDRFGAEVFINRRFIESRKTCFISSVEPHYFAGFTGGRKSIIPGLADLSTIERNHNLANSLDAMPMRLEGNPVAEHLQELMSLVDSSGIFAIQLVIDATHKTVGVFAGGIEECFRQAVELSRRTYSQEVAEPYDAVVCEMLPPLDDNLYQAQKALENCQAVVADGGSAIVLSACDGGIGSSHFFELADLWDREANRPIDGVQRFGSHKLSRVNAMGRRIDVRLHSNLADDTVRRVFYQPLADVSAYLQDRAGDRQEFRVAVVHDAGHTVMTKEHI
jgi:nickel-dependent lactate racemase